MSLPDILRGSEFDWLVHPLIGRYRALSALAVGYTVVVVLATIVAIVLYAGAVEIIPGWYVRFVDGFTGGLIIAVVLSATVLPILYALVNGGPLMAAAIALTPFVTASLVKLEYTLTNDLVVALTGAALGATVAVTVEWYRRARRTSAIAPDRAAIDGLLVASGLSALGFVAIWRFDQSAPSDIVATIDPAHWLIVVPATGCVGLWLLFGVLLRREKTN